MMTANELIDGLMPYRTLLARTVVSVLSDTIVKTVVW